MSQKEISTRYEEKKDLIELLKEAQNKFGYVPEDVMGELSQSLEIPINEVYGVASFYSFISTRPSGRNVIRICQSVPCYLEHCRTIIENVEKEIGIKPGETTPDGRFSFQLTNCIGLCDGAPAMMVNDDIHVDLTPEKISQVLKNYK